MNNTNIVRIISADGAARKAVARPVQKPVTVKPAPIASAFAVHMSEKLREATVHTRKKMFETLFNAGVTSIDGWSIHDLIRGRLNPQTGERTLPSGEKPKDIATTGGTDGRYYGSRIYAPITSLYQTGVVWSPAS